MGQVEAAPCQVDLVLAGELVGASETGRDLYEMEASRTFQISLV